MRIGRYILQAQPSLQSNHIFNQSSRKLPSDRYANHDIPITVLHSEAGKSFIYPCKTGFSNSRGYKELS